MDFSHLFARTGKFNSEKEFDEVISTLKDELGADALGNMHIHMSGISSNSKGDLKHLNLPESNFNWQGLLNTLKKYDCRGYIICNSPNLEVDARMMKDYYMSL